MAKDSLGQSYCNDRNCLHDHEQCPNYRIDTLEAEVKELKQHLRIIAKRANRTRMVAEEGLGLDKPFKQR